MDTYYYIKPICKLESGPTKWSQISETIFFPFFQIIKSKRLIFNEFWTLQSRQFRGHNSLKKCYEFITYNEIEGFFTNLKHVIVSRVMTLRKFFFGKYEICDGICSSLLCAIKKIKIHKFITYPKGCFSWPILNKVVKKGWMRGTFNLDMEKDVKFNIISKFLCLCSIFYIKKYVLKNPKINFAMIFWVHPRVLAPWKCVLGLHLYQLITYLGAHLSHLNVPCVLSTFITTNFQQGGVESIFVAYLQIKYIHIFLPQ